jgi:hypothetical protein
MIGVAANPADLAISAEFFELFKTPWEPAAPGRKYRALLWTGGRIEGLEADVVLAYGSNHEALPSGGAIRSGADLQWNGGRLPVYGRVSLFDRVADKGGVTAGDGSAAERQIAAGGRRIWHIGYDLFGEIRHLLTKGQPPALAAVPTLELHIALMRQLLHRLSVSFVEVPPRPHGHDFICCLTHDIDFFGIRRHRLDRTLVGFLARASVGTLVDLIRRRRRPGEALRNWMAVCSLPLVYLRLARDFWQPFDDYARVETPRHSTFFLIPFKGRPGLGPDGTASRGRAVSYDVADVPAEVFGAAALGAEVAVHAIDAWRDEAAGRSERRRLGDVSGREAEGVRMHWLYFDSDSPRKLEAAGFGYDSTWGYNETVGWRAGTAQAFRFPGTSTLLELPLSIMDTALFYRARLGLARDEAVGRCDAIVANARRFGGALVVNWHDRSLAPERLWGEAYDGLLDRVRSAGSVWFATGSEATEWFRWRRSISFVAETADVVTLMAPASSQRPAVVEVHRAMADGFATETLSFDGVGTREVRL